MLKLRTQLCATLIDGFYSNLRNDVAKLVNGRLIILFEHQSTVNENMPLRMLLYLASIYQEKLEPKIRYKTKLQKIPRPFFVVFYNGDANYPEKTILRIEDAFEQSEPCDELDKYTMLHLDVPIFNINYSPNLKILQRSELLRGYSFLCHNIEQSKKEGAKDFVRAGILKKN